MLNRREFGISTTAAALGTGLLGQVGTAIAQVAYPDKPVKLVFGYAPGTAGDVLLRVLANRLGERTGKTFVVENRPGVGGVIAADYVAKSAPDGYTLFAAANSMANTRYVMDKLPFDLFKDFTYITPFTNLPLVMVVYPGLGVNTIQELVALIKSKPGQLKFGTAGVGSSLNIQMLIFLQRLGLQAIPVHYKDGGQYAMDMARGEIDFGLDAPGSIAGNIQAKKQKVLAFGALNRFPSLPDVPTFSESIIPGYQMVGWVSLVGPKNVPQSVVDYIAREVNAVVKESAFIQRAQGYYMDPVGGDGATVRAWFEQADKMLQEAEKLGAFKDKG